MSEKRKPVSSVTVECTSTKEAYKDAAIEQGLRGPSHSAVSLRHQAASQPRGCDGEYAYPSRPSYISDQSTALTVQYFPLWELARRKARGPKPGPWIIEQ